MTLTLYTLSFIVVTVTAIVVVDVINTLFGTTLSVPDVSLSEPVLLGGFVVVFTLWTAFWMYSPLPDTNGGVADPGGGHWQQWGWTSDRPNTDGDNE